MTNLTGSIPNGLVRIVDCTLTAGQSALWRGQMTNEMLLPVVDRLDAAGFEAIELIDPFVFESCWTDLGEDPWTRIRLAGKRLARTPAAAWVAGRYLFARLPASDDQLRSTVGRLALNGISRVGCYDPVNHVAELKVLIHESKAAGLTVCGGIVFALGDTYDELYFRNLASTLAEFGCQSVALLDFSGVLHPERARDVVPAMRAELGHIPIEIRTHCRSSRAEIACFASLEGGATTIHAASEPLSGGDSVPAVDFFVEHLAREGYGSTLDRDIVAAVRDYFEGVADYWCLPKATTRLYDAAVDRHQLPVVLESRLAAAFEQYGRERFLEKIATARAARGDPPMAFPTAMSLCEEVDENIRQSAVNAASADRSSWDIHAVTPLAQLLGELDRRPWVRRIRIEFGDLVLELGSATGLINVEQR